MNRLRRTAVALALPALVLGGYGWWSHVALDPFYPSVPVIWQRFDDLFVFERVGSDVVPSLRNLAAGYGAAAAGGIAMGLLLGRVRLLRELASPLTTFGRSIPPIMLIPPLVLVLGIGDPSKVAIIAFGAVFPVLIATIDGLRRADPALLDVARSIGLGRASVVRRVWLPSATPSIFGGLQTGLQLALVLMVASEMVAAYRGLGYMTMQAQLTFDAPTVWAGIVVLAVLGFVLNYVFTLVRRRVLSWQIGMRAVSASR